MHRFSSIVFLVLTASSLGGCVSTTRTDDTPISLQADAAGLGRVAVLSMLNDGVLPESSRDRKEGEVFDALCAGLDRCPGTSVVSPDAMLCALPPKQVWPGADTDAILAAARGTGVDTICLVRVSELNGWIRIGLVPLPGWRSDMVIDFDLELLDVASGDVLTSTRRHRRTGGYLAVGSPEHIARGFAEELERALTATMQGTNGAL